MGDDSSPPGLPPPAQVSRVDDSVDVKVKHIRNKKLKAEEEGVL